MCAHRRQRKILYFQKKKQLFKTIALAAVVFILCFGLVSFNLYKKKEAISRLDAELAKVNPTAKETQDIKNKIAIIKAQLDDEHSCLEVLREIHEITPPNIYLINFMFEDEKEVILKGNAPSMSLVFSFVPILNKSEFFENAQVKYATQRKTRRGELTDFEIICPLSSSAKEK